MATVPPPRSGRADVTYTGLAVIGVVGALVLDLAVLRTGVVRRRLFWTSYAIVVSFQLLTNGWLTGRDIVTYDPAAILGARVVFAPVEDLLFGFSLVVQTLSWWVFWGRRLRSGERRPVSAATTRPDATEPGATGPAAP